MSDKISEPVRDLLEKATLEHVRYIKLGKGNCWWQEAKESNTPRLGFREFDFNRCDAGDFDGAKADFERAHPCAAHNTGADARETCAADRMSAFGRSGHPRLTVSFSEFDPICDMGGIWEPGSRNSINSH